MTKLPKADSISVHFSTQFSIHFFQDQFHFQLKKQLRFQSSRVCPLATFTSTKIFLNRPQASLEFSTFSSSAFLQGKFWIYSVSPKSPPGFAHLLFRFSSNNILTFLGFPKIALGTISFCPYFMPREFENLIKRSGNELVVEMNDDSMYIWWWFNLYLLMVSHAFPDD